jgi:hypothetical protein
MLLSPAGVSVAGALAVDVGRRSLVWLCLRALLVWALVCLAILAVQRPLMTVLLPYVDAIIRLLQWDFVPSLRLVEVKGHWIIEMIPFLMRAVPLTDDLALRPFFQLEPFVVNVNHALVPLVLLLAAVGSWPFAHCREALARMLLTVAALPLVLALTLPVLLVGRVQMAIVELALQHSAKFHEPGLVSLMIFMESGGCWLLPLTLAVACVFASKRLCIRPTVPAPPKLMTDVAREGGFSAGPCPDR